MRHRKRYRYVIACAGTALGSVVACCEEHAVFEFLTSREDWGAVASEHPLVLQVEKTARVAAHGGERRDRPS